MTSVRVKICGITRAPDLRAAVRAGADALGFVFAERSKRCLDSALAAELASAVPAFVCRVGLFMDQDAAEVERILGGVQLDLLQFHGSEGADYCRQFGRPYLKAVSMAAPGAVTKAEAEYFDAAGLLLDSHQPGGLGGTGRVFDWASIPDAALPLVLAGGLTPGNVREAVTAVRPWAVDVSSGVEDAPGVKNEELMLRFISEAKQ
ncbi:MAG: phosphoribosylanthranilate isomerase [Gammaproteobacteria bacterium]|nr:phosphoribosylanthranilate isomerase [Gammaproteobacteria bacterium]